MPGTHCPLTQSNANDLIKISPAKFPSGGKPQAEAPGPCAAELGTRCPVPGLLDPTAGFFKLSASPRTWVAAAESRDNGNIVRDRSQALGTKYNRSGVSTVDGGEKQWEKSNLPLS